MIKNKWFFLDDAPTSELQQMKNKYLTLAEEKLNEGHGILFETIMKRVFKIEGILNQRAGVSA